MCEVGGEDALDSCQVSGAAAAEQMLGHPKKRQFYLRFVFASVYNQNNKVIVYNYNSTTCMCFKQSMLDPNMIQRKMICSWSFQTHLINWDPS